MDVLIAEDVSGAALDGLAARFRLERDERLHADRARLLARIAEARALVVRNRTRVDAEVLSAGKELLVVGRCGAGLDNVDVETASRLGIVVTAAPEENSVSVAELVMALMLCLARRICAVDRSTRAGEWKRLGFPANELYGKTLGLLGIGRIGMRVALRARAFQMRIVAHDPFISPVAAAVSETGAELVDLDELLRRSDVLSVHLPLTEGTRGILSVRAFERMKPSAYLINTSRGEVIDEGALLAALREGRLDGAALDVRASEPPVRGALEELPNVILTPHFAGLTAEAQERVTAAVARDVAAVLDGRRALNYVNFPAPTRS